MSKIVGESADSALPEFNDKVTSYIDDSPKQPNNPKPRRHWFRFSLRTLLILTVLLSLAFGWLGSILVRVRHQRSVVRRIEALGGNVAYDYVFDKDGGRHAPGPKALRVVLGEDAFLHVDGVNLSEGTTDEDLSLLLELPELSSVFLSGPKVTDASVNHLLRVPRLQRLTLAYSNVTADGLARLREAKTLTSLSLMGPAVDDGTLEGLQSLSKIESLQLIRTSVTSEGLIHVRSLSELKNLNVFDGVGIGDRGLYHVAALKSLESIWFLKTSVTDAGLQEVSRMKPLKQIRLETAPITGKGLSHVTELPKLTGIWLGNTSVDDVGVETLSACALENLGLQGTLITDRAIVHVAKMKQLQTLDISFTAVTDAELAQLGTLTQLRHLSIGPNVTQEAARNLKQSIPNCEISLVDKSRVSHRISLD